MANAKGGEEQVLDGDQLDWFGQRMKADIF